MPAAESRALDAVLPTNAGRPGRPGADASDGRALYEVAVLRVAADGGGAASRRPERKPQARAPADAGDGGLKRSTRNPTPARATRITRFTHVSCAGWRLTGRI